MVAMRSRSVRLALTPPAITAFEAGLLQRTLAFDHQRIHYRIFKGAGDIGARLFVTVMFANGIRREGFQAGEAEVQPGRSVIGRGNLKRSGVPCCAMRDSIGPPG